MCLFEFIMITLFQAHARLARLFRQPNRDVQPALDVQPASHPVALGEHHVLGDSNNEHMRYR